MTKSVLGWYFSPDDMRLANGDGRLIVAGQKHEVALPLRLCSRGLHASRQVSDALRYATSGVVWRVRLSGHIVEGSDKMCAEVREYLWGYNASDVLRAFARKCALDVIDKWGAPAVVREYLKTGDVSIRSAAESAAWSAAWSAAESAAEKRLLHMIRKGRPSS